MGLCHVIPVWQHYRGHWVPVLQIGTSSHKLNHPRLMNSQQPCSHRDMSVDVDRALNPYTHTNIRNKTSCLFYCNK